jgi:hydrogenase/urease accessory protein HupE
MKSLHWLVLTLFTLVSSAAAHWADLAVAEVSSTDQAVTMTLTYPTGLTAFADTDKNGALSNLEITQHQSRLEAALGAKIVVSSGEARGTLEVSPAMADVNLPEGVSSRSHTTLTLVYRFVEKLEGYAIRYELFVPGVSTASCVATIRGGEGIQSVVFTPQNLEFSVGGETAPVDFRGFVLLGIEHILTGYDHLLFLLALLALGGGLRAMLKVVTAFTVAHSVTLALTTLHVIHLPAQIVESGIALSIAVVALENLIRRKDAAKLERGRWLVTFAFGLLHGMGFAGILEELRIPASNLPGALVGFNLGVELGQLAVVLPAFGLLKLLERVRFNLPVQYAASAVAVAAGAYWFLERAFLGA